MKIINLNKNTFLAPNEDKSFSIYTYERLMINSEETREIFLPYTRDYINGEIVIMNINYDLAARGLQILSHNINDFSYQGNFQFLLYNNNRAEKPNQLNQIIGNYKYKIDVLSNTELCRVWVVKV